MVTQLLYAALRYANLVVFRHELLDHIKFLIFLDSDARLHLYDVVVSFLNLSTASCRI
jgi:hypothetical protein